MINFLICLIISIFLSIGLSIIFVEKSNEWPIKKYRVLLQLLLHDHIHYKFAQVLKCTVCSSFWFSLISDIVVCILAYFHGYFYFFWPCSGAISLGLTWILVEFLNSQDKESNINVFVDKEN